MTKGRIRPRGTKIGDILCEQTEVDNSVNLHKTSALALRQQKSQMKQAQRSSSMNHISEIESQPQFMLVSSTQNQCQDTNMSSQVTKGGRGPSKLPDEWDSGIKLQVSLNDEGQLIGPVEQYNKFVTALGALSRIGSYLPLNYARWSDMPIEKHNDIWKDIQDNTTLPPEAKKIVLRTLNDMWRDWKCRVKAMCFTPYLTDPDHKIPESVKQQVDLDQLSELMLYWKNERVQEMARNNMANRAKKKHLHRTGKLAFPILKEKMRKEGKSITKLDVLIESRSRGKGLIADPETATLIQGIKDELSKTPESEKTKQFKDDLFMNIMGHDPQSHGKCTGRGIKRRDFHDSLESIASTYMIDEKIEEFRKLKNELAFEFEKIEKMKIELNNQKKELDEDKERGMNDIRSEFKDEFDNVKLNMDYVMSLVDPTNLQTVLANTPSLRKQVANLSDIPHESSKKFKETISNFHQAHHSPPTNLLRSRVQAGNEMSRDINTWDFNQCKEGSDVLLYCLELPKEIVAEGVVLSTNPKEEIDNVVLGPEFVKVVIKKAVKPNYNLLRPHKGINTIGEAVGKIVAWQIANVLEF